MQYLILGAIAAIAIVIILRLYNKRMAKAKREKLRTQWGKPKEEFFYFDGIKKYAEAAPPATFHQLNEQTIQDIDLYNVFTFIDRTTSKIGQQYLFKRIVQPSNSPVNELEENIEVFSKDAALREEVQLEFLRLSHSDAYYVSSLLTTKILERPTWFYLLVLDVALVTLLLILAFKYPIAIIWLLIPFTINLLLHYWNKSNAFQFARSFPQLNQLINTSKQLLKRGRFFENESARKAVETLKPFQRKWRLLSFNASSGMEAELSQIGNYFSELLKAFFLVEVFTLIWVAKELEAKQDSIIGLMDYVGRLDASISITSLRQGDVKTCRPSFISSGKRMEITGLFHPLITDCVKNDLSIADKSVMITGSNMSGKSTFLRTLAINSILAQTIYTCFAERFVSPILKQFSSIRIDDNLFQGKSYYLQEVNVMGALVKEADSGGQNIFLLDEVFKGTNTVERIAASKAILSHLTKSNNLVVIATHDIELCEMLNTEYELYHFCETVEDSQLYFDHKLKAGPLKTRNAIKILELSNYPKEIIEEAKQISSKLDSGR